MKNIYILICVLCSLCVKSQTIFWYENFGVGTNCSSDQGYLLGNYSDGLGSWTANTFSVGLNDPYANIWYVSQTEGGRTVGTCGKGCLDSVPIVNRTMHIANVPGSPNSSVCPTGDCGAKYDPGVGTNQVKTNIRAESPVISCVGKTGVSLQFDYILRGDTAHDYLTVWYFDGAIWNFLGKPVPTLTCNISNPLDTEGIWTTQVYTLPTSADNNAAVKIGFKWVNNDDSIGGEPSVAIDNVTLLANSSTSLPSTLTVTIVPPDSANPAFVYCTGTPYNFTGVANPGPITFYQWSCTPSANVIFNPSPAWQNGEAITFPSVGTYTLTLSATSQNNGVHDTTRVITVVQTPTINVTPLDLTICNGGTGDTLHAHGATTYTWTQAPSVIPVTYLDANGDSVIADPASINPPQAFNYTVTGTANGCVSLPVVVTVSVVAIPTPHYSAKPDTICAGQHTILSVDSMPITTTYTWSSPGGMNGGLGTYHGQSAQATPIYTWSPTHYATPSDTNITIQVQINLTGCPPYPPHQILVYVLPLPHVQVTDTIDNCNHMGDTLKAVTTPTANVGLSWIPKGALTPLHSTLSDTNEVFVNPTTPKTYYVTPINQYGCAGPRDSVIVLLGDTTNASVASNFGIICSGQSVQLIAYPQNPPITPNTTPYSYSWGVSSGGGTINTFTTSIDGDTTMVNPTATIIYTVTVHGVCVKHDIAQVSIQVNNCVTPNVFFSTSADTICVGHCITFKDSTQFLSQKPLYYTWVFPGGSIVPYPTSTVTATYTLQFNSLTNSPVKPIKVCYQINSLLNQNPKDGVMGYYPVIEIVKNGIGQVDSLIDSVRVNPGPIANAGNNQTIDQGSSATLCGGTSTLPSQTTFYWSQPDSAYMSCPTCSCSTVVTPSTTTQYTLTLTDKNGCTDTASVTIIVDIICKDIFVATAFSPNGDGLNDVLHVKSNCALSNFSFKIFDRWGELVFQSTEEGFGWDGTYKDKKMNDGVFMYTVDAFLSNGKEVKKKGNVTLLR